MRLIFDIDVSHTNSSLFSVANDGFGFSVKKSHGKTTVFIQSAKRSYIKGNPVAYLCHRNMKFALGSAFAAGLRENDVILAVSQRILDCDSSLER